MRHARRRQDLLRLHPDPFTQSHHYLIHGKSARLCKGQQPINTNTNTNMSRYIRMEEEEEEEKERRFGAAYIDKKRHN